MEKYDGNKIDIKGNYKIAGIDEITTTDKDNNIVLTTDIKTCIVILIITTEEASMLHIETETILLNITKINDMLKQVKGNILDINIFTGTKSNHEVTKTIKKLLNVEKEYIPYLDCSFGNDNGSIGYNFKTKEYYGIDNDYNFYEYKLGLLNKKEEIELQVINFVKK